MPADTALRACGLASPLEGRLSASKARVPAPLSVALRWSFLAGLPCVLSLGRSQGRLRAPVLRPPRRARHARVSRTFLVPHALLERRALRGGGGGASAGTLVSEIPHLCSSTQESLSLTVCTNICDGTLKSGWLWTRKAFF